MTAPSTFAFSLACGTAGAWVDVTADVLFEEGPIPFTDGRSSQFDGFGPGTGSLTLADGDGKYTPDNAGSSLAVPLSEGMGITMELDGLLLSGTIRSVALVFPPLGLPDTARVRITWDDMLGNAARHELTEPLGSEMVLAASPYLFYPLVDVSEWSGLKPLAPNPEYDASGVVFGADGPAGDTQVTFTIPSSLAWQQLRVFNPTPLNFVYPSGSLGVVGCWVTPSSDADWSFEVVLGAPGTTTGGILLQGSQDETRGYIGVGAAFVYATGAALQAGVASYVAGAVSYIFAAGNYTYTMDLYVNGSLAATGTTAPVATASGTLCKSVGLGLTTSPAGEFVKFSHLSHTVSLVHEERALAGVTEAARLEGIAAAVPEITLDTLPAGLATAPLAASDEGGSALDAFNEVIRAEQGYMWVETTGTLLNPVPKIKVAARDRERPVDYTFDVSEILDPILFIRTLTNTVSQFTANGPETSATYQDADLIPLVGSASSSDSVPLRDFIDLYGYASDRVVRGEAHGIAVASITIDATSPDINRWPALTAIRQGYRLRITGLPQPPLENNTWDGVVVGREIVNTQDSRTDEPKSFFTFHLAPVPHAAFTLDTDELAAGTSLTLTANITNSATSFTVTFADARFTTSANFPHTIRIGSECMTLTAVSGTTTPQTFTVTRAAIDPVTGLATTAVAHTAGDTIEIADPDVLGF